MIYALGFIIGAIVFVTFTVFMVKMEIEKVTNNQIEHFSAFVDEEINKLKGE